MANDALIVLEESNFKETISSGVTLVDFWAQWCGPCRMLGPIVEKIAGDIGSKAKIGKLNIDENPNIAAEYNVMSIPTVIIYKDGEVVNQFVGVQGEEVLVEALNSAI